MRKILIAIGILFCSTAGAEHALAASMFDTFFDEALRALPNVQPSDELTDFVIEEMKNWETKGILLTPADISAAMQGKLWDGDGSGLCQKKADMAGNPYNFVQGADISEGGNCIGLRSAVLDLLSAEQSAEQLASDLLTIAGASELAVADEPHRPMNMAALALLLRRVWSGTGAAVVPWDGSADDAVTALEASLSGSDVDKIVLRFQHGVFRDDRESDPRFLGIGDTAKNALKTIASKLNIVGDPTNVGIFALPKLGVSNVALWARQDDLGLLWIYPSHWTRLKIEKADDYPEFKDDGERLAYPFDYEGEIPPSRDGIVSPLCSRMVGRYGYLCRNLPPLDPSCQNSGPNAAINLIECSGKVTLSKAGPSVCPDFDKLFQDTGEPLTDPIDLGRFNPNLQKADTTRLCTPETKTLYQDDITSHSCFIGFCLLQSMSGHTLLPNRNPTLVNEATSPYLACLRPDPQIGLYTEIAKHSPYPLPDYLGEFLVRDFDRQLCTVNGSPPHPLSAMCLFQDNETAASPNYTQIFHALKTEEEQGLVQIRHDAWNQIALSIGQRTALDQTIALERKVFARLASVIEQIAGLLLGLKRAELTQTACPWTGPFRGPVP